MHKSDEKNQVDAKLKKASENFDCGVEDLLVKLKSEKE